MKNISKANTICVQFVILAAGKGTRMNEGRPSPIPKVLIPLHGKPMVSYILEILKNLRLTTYGLRLTIGKPILVIGYKGKMIQERFGDSCDYVWQRQRLGTGHAARLAIDYITKNCCHPEAKLKDLERFFANAQNDNKNLVFILQGDDSAFYKPETLNKIIKNHIKEKVVLTFVTTRLPDVKDLGRVVRDKNKNVVGIVEKENMTPEIAKINEINCGAYLFNLDWGVSAIKKITRHLKGGKEYPLPDIIKIALSHKPEALSKDKSKGYKLHVTSCKHPVIAYEIPSAEWRGINSPEQLKLAENKIKNSNFKL